MTLRHIPDTHNSRVEGFRPKPFRVRCTDITCVRFDSTSARRYPRRIIKSNRLFDDDKSSLGSLHTRARARELQSDFSVESNSSYFHGHAVVYCTRDNERSIVPKREKNGRTHHADRTRHAFGGRMRVQVSLTRLIPAEGHG